MIKSIFPVLCLLLAVNSCSTDYSPKRRGYPRISLPGKSFTVYKSSCPFTFDYPELCYISDAGNPNEPCWFNIDYPRLNARIHLSYKPVGEKLHEYLEDSRTLVYKHTVKANAIRQNDIIVNDAKLYARIFEIDGDVASFVQFYATDSTNHFLRGSLYFNAASNADSLEPAIEYISEDIYRLVKSIRWK